MRTRRGSVTIEALMLVPVAIVMILMARAVLEGSLNRQETAVFARGSTIAAAAARSAFRSCDFEREQFGDLADVEQTATVRCSRRGAEGGLSDEQPMWDEVEDGARAWDDILRDVKPRRGPRDVVATAEVTLTLETPAFLNEQNAATSAQRHIAPDRVLWTHSERGYDAAHSGVIWDELCRSGTYRLFPNVFPKDGGPRC